jgi:hypothetical protein
MDDLNNNSSVETPVETAPVDGGIADFNDIVDEVVEVEASPEAAPEPTPVSTPIPEGPPASAAPDGSLGEATGVVPPGAPVVTPAPPVVQPVAAQAPAPAPAPMVDPGPALLQQREALVSEIAQKYAMPEAVKDQFLLNPEQVLPTMAARLYVDVFEAVLQTVMTQVPQVMAVRENQARVAKQTEDSFFQRWPSLKRPELVQDILGMGRAYRQQYPQATFEQAIEAVGAMVSVARGIPLPGQAAPAQAPPQARPPIPVGPGASRAPLPPATQKSLWEDIFNE